MPKPAPKPKQKPSPVLDLQFNQSGGMAIVQPLTQNGHNWVKTHLNFENWQVVNETAIVVDHCTVDDLRQNAINDGLTVK